MLNLTTMSFLSNGKCSRSYRARYKLLFLILKVKYSLSFLQVKVLGYASSNFLQVTYIVLSVLVRKQ